MILNATGHSSRHRTRSPADVFFSTPIKAEGITHLPHKIVAFLKKTEAITKKDSSNLCFFLYAQPLLSGHTHQKQKWKGGRENRKEVRTGVDL